VGTNAGGETAETDYPAVLYVRQEGFGEESSPFSKTHDEIKHDSLVSVTNEDHVSSDFAGPAVESDLDHERTILGLLPILLIIELQTFLRGWAWTWRR